MKGICGFSGCPELAAPGRILCHPHNRENGDRSVSREEAVLAILVAMVRYRRALRETEL